MCGVEERLFTLHNGLDFLDRLCDISRGAPIMTGLKPCREVLKSVHQERWPCGGMQAVIKLSEATLMKERPSSVDPKRTDAGSAAAPATSAGRVADYDAMVF